MIHGHNSNAAMNAMSQTIGGFNVPSIEPVSTPDLGNTRLNNEQTYTASLLIHTDDRLWCRRSILLGPLVIIPFILTADGLAALLERFMVLHTLMCRVGLDIVAVSLYRVVVCLAARPSRSRVVLGDAGLLGLDGCCQREWAYGDLGEMRLRGLENQSHGLGW